MPERIGGTLADILAILAVILALGFSIGWGTAGLYEAHPNSYRYAAQQCAKAQQFYPAPNTVAITPLKDIDAKSTTSDTPAEPTKQDRIDDEPDWCDLAAQHSMANSTYWMNVAAWVGVVVGCGGLFLIFRTLRATQDTLVEAEKTTEIARRHLRQEFAPYVVILDGKLSPTPNGFNLQFNLSNIGKSPATALWLRGSVQVVPEREIGPAILTSEADVREEYGDESTFIHVAERCGDLLQEEEASVECFIWESTIGPDEAFEALTFGQGSCFFHMSVSWDGLEGINGSSNAVLMVSGQTEEKYPGMIAFALKVMNRTHSEHHPNKPPHHSPPSG